MNVRGKRGRSANGEIRKGPEVIAGFVCPNCNSGDQSLNYFCEPEVEKDHALSLLLENCALSKYDYFHFLFSFFQIDLCSVGVLLSLSKSRCLRCLKHQF